MVCGIPGDRYSNPVHPCHTLLSYTLNYWVDYVFIQIVAMFSILLIQLLLYYFWIYSIKTNIHVQLTNTNCFISRKSQTNKKQHIAKKIDPELEFNITRKLKLDTSKLLI